MSVVSVLSMLPASLNYIRAHLEWYCVHQPVEIKQMVLTADRAELDALTTLSMRLLSDDDKDLKAVFGFIEEARKVSDDEAASV